MWSCRCQGGFGVKLVQAVVTLMSWMAPKVTTRKLRDTAVCVNTRRRESSVMHTSQVLPINETQRVELTAPKHRGSSLLHACKVLPEKSQMKISI